MGRTLEHPSQKQHLPDRNHNMTFHDDFAMVVGQGAPYRITGSDEAGWQIRFENNTVLERFIQYRIDDGVLSILSLVINDEPEGGGHILRIAAEAADLFKQAGLKKIRGYDFGMTAAGSNFESKVRAVKNVPKEGKFTVLDIEDFQKLKKTK
jgi:hypothetical protein